MAVTISWTGGPGTDTIDPSGANDTIKFARSSFSSSVRVGQYQDTSWVSDDSGSTNYNQLTNTKYVDASGVSLDGASRADLTAIPVSGVTVRIHFNESADPVQLQNSEFIVYDGVDVDNDPTGVTVQVFEASITPSGTLSTASASGLNANGNSVWTSVHGSTTLPLITQSGLDTDHYVYLGISVTPSSVGAKTWSMQYSTEYL